MARPTKYKEKYCEAVIEHMKGGASLASFAASIGTHREVLWQWRQKHELFNNACLTAKELSQKWWENIAIQIATGYIYHPDHKGKYNKHNVGMVQFIMKQRFEDYRQTSKVEEPIEQPNGVNLTVNLNGDELTDEIDRRIERRRRRAGKAPKG